MVSILLRGTKFGAFEKVNKKNKVSKLILMKSNVEQAGLGVFAVKTIPNNCCIIEYSGIRVRRDTLRSAVSDKKIDVRGACFIGIEKDDVVEGSGLASFVNSPNADNHANCKFSYDRKYLSTLLKLFWEQRIILWNY